MIRVFLAIVCLFASTAARADARAAVVDILAKSGIKFGLDKSAQRYVFIGTCSRRVTDPANDGAFMINRNKMFIVAELNAKRDILNARRAEVTMSDANKIQDAEKGGCEETRAIYKLISRGELNGMTDLCSAESWDGDTKEYQIAVAVSWSAKLSAVAMKVEHRDLPHGTVVTDSPSWEVWAKKQNLETTIGTRQFVDSRGRRYFAGIGAADIDGKRGVLFKKGMRLANAYALRNLAYAVYVDAVSIEVAESVLRVIERDGLSDSEAWETYTNQFMQKIANKIVRGHEVYSCEKIHPITGRQMYVSVYGIGPDQLLQN